MRTMRAVGAEAGGAVMATGIVSVAMLADGRTTLSRVLLVLTAASWALLGALFFARLAFDRARWLREARRPASLTAVAGSAVLGTRVTLLGWTWVGWVLLVIATALYAALIGSVLRARPLPRTGGEFLAVVAPQSLAVLAASLGGRLGASWPALLALAPFVLGLLAYPVVLARFELAQLRAGAGEHWISGGALAISTLACADIARAATRIHETLRIASLALWALTIAWLPLLIVAELGWRRVAYDARRWATVFPLGMYSVMSSATGSTANVHALVDLGNAWAWVALAAWAVTAMGLVRSAIRAVRAPAGGSVRPRARP
jgi:tellurite resistance protein TehA-like permease